MSIGEVIQASQMEEQLFKQIQQMTADEEFDLQKVPGLSFQMADQGDVVKFNNAINSTGEIGKDMSVSMQNMDQALVNIGRINSPEANAIGNAIRENQNRVPGISDRLNAQMAEARINNAQYEHRLSQFFSSVQNRLKRVTNIISELSRKPDMSQGDIMRVQYEITQMGIMLDVASKVGDKGSQALQTLFRDK
ncbi:MAG: hypothetical protein LBI56_01945 [Puniceicoccales bacterium]|jgi:phage gp29-like protein|nr:hypothetical protein [Puniceicoccales bacterium]